MKKNYLIKQTLCIVVLTVVLTFGFVASTYAFTLGGTVPGKWGSPVFGTGATVTWSLMGSGLNTDGGVGSSVALSSFMPAGFKAEIEAAFDAWSAVANLTFLEVGDVVAHQGGVGGGDIRITGHAFDGPGGTLAHAYFPPNNLGTSAGDLHFDIAENWKIGFGGAGFDIFQVAAHEIGHAIGLGHTGVANSLMNPFYTEAFSGPQADDIAGAQFIYGAAQQPPPQVPEPGTLLLLGVGLLLGFAVRRRLKV